MPKIQITLRVFMFLRFLLTFFFFFLFNFHKKCFIWGKKSTPEDTFITTCFFLIFLNETVRFVCEINNPFDISGALDDAVLFQRQAGEGRAAGED